MIFISQSEPDQSKWSNWHWPKVWPITSWCSFNHNISQDQWYRYDTWHNDRHLHLIINLIYCYCSSKYTRTCLCHLLTAAIVIPISSLRDVHSTKTIHKIAVPIKGMFFVDAHIAIIFSYFLIVATLFALVNNPINSMNIIITIRTITWQNLWAEDHRQVQPTLGLGRMPIMASEKLVEKSPINFRYIAAFPILKQSLAFIIHALTVFIPQSCFVLYIFWIYNSFLPCTTTSNGLFPWQQWYLYFDRNETLKQKHYGWQCYRHNYIRLTLPLIQLYMVFDLATDKTLFVDLTTDTTLYSWPIDADKTLLLTLTQTKL